MTGRQPPRKSVGEIWDGDVRMHKFDVGGGFLALPFLSALPPCRAGPAMGKVAGPVGAVAASGAVRASPRHVRRTLHEVNARRGPARLGQHALIVRAEAARVEVAAVGTGWQRVCPNGNNQIMLVCCFVVSLVCITA